MSQCQPSRGAVRAQGGAKSEQRIIERRFLATVSHELRTPLNASSMGAHARAKQLPADRTDKGSRPSSVTRRLAHIIDDLRDVSRSRRNFAGTCLSLLPWRSRSGGSPLPWRDIDLTFTRSLSDQAVSGAAIARPVLLNLLGNAKIKFTSEGRPRELSIERSDHR